MFSRKKKEPIDIDINIKIDDDGNISIVYPTDSEVNFNFTINDELFFGPNGLMNGNGIRQKFVIPVGDISKEEAEKSLTSIISDYKEDVNWEDDTEFKFTVNGKEYVKRTPLRFQKEYWFSTGTGTPNIDKI